MDKVYKVSVTTIASHKVHSVEELNYKQKYGDVAKDLTKMTIQEETGEILRTGNTAYYTPELKGFVKDKTSAVYYETNNDGTINETELTVPITDYISNKQNVLERDSTNYTFYNYEKQIWANIKVEGSGVDTYWTWIPRYAYSITGNTTSIIFVDVNNKPLSGEPLSENYIVHPAFENGKKGIWVSKYEIVNEIVDIPTTNNIAFPDLTGFDPSTTYIEEYKDDGTFAEKPLSTIGNIEEYKTNKKWYDYSNKIWANIKTDAAGTECWWVWIPSYAYSITGTETRIIFLDENGNPLDGSTLPANYIPHPAFTGRKGIWVSKYEMEEN